MIVTIEELKELIEYIERKSLKNNDSKDNAKKILNEDIKVHDVNELLDGFDNIVNPLTDSRYAREY